MVLRSLTELNCSFVHEGRNWNKKVARSRTFTNTTSSVVVRTVARAEPATELALLAQRHTAEVRADAHLNEPLHHLRTTRDFRQTHGRAYNRVLVLCVLIRQIGKIDCTCSCNFFFCAGADENRLTLPQNSQLRAWINWR